MHPLVCGIVTGTTTGRTATTTTGFVLATVFLKPDIPDGNTGDIGSFLSCQMAKSASHGVLVPKGSVPHG